MSSIRLLTIVISLLLVGSLISCGGGGPAAVNETWSLVKLLSKGVPIDNVVPETVEVRNCIVPETKTTDCSAGTASSLSINFGGGIEFGAGIIGSIDGSVSAGLGIGQQSGQSILLDVPQFGYIYIYEVNKRFSVISGEAVARSNNGREQTVNYVFNATCSITIVAQELSNCSNPGPDASATPPNQTSSINFTVYANQGWQDAGITLNAGDALTIQYVSGLWRWTGDRADYDGNGDPSANGTYLDICTTNYDCPITDAPLDALVGRIGVSGTPFLIGNGLTYTVPSGSGNNQKLFLMGNDSLSGLHDNVGSIEVSIAK